MENACNEAGEGEPGGRKEYQVIDSEVGGSPRNWKFCLSLKHPMEWELSSSERDLGGGGG